MYLYGEPMNLTIRHFEMLVAAADFGSFSRAAESLSISQPAFSEGIRNIEQQVGYRLFDRTTRSLDLTADGKRIVATARDLVRDFKVALEGIREGANNKGPVTIASLPSLVAAVMPTALKRFSVQYPETEVVIHDVPQERALAMVLDGIADVGITTAMTRRDDLKFMEIAPDPFVAVMAKNNRLQKKSQIRWKDLAEFPFIALTGLSSIRQVTDAAFMSADTTPQLRCEVEQILSAVALVEADYGVTALPSTSQAMFQARKVVTRPLLDPIGHRRIGIAILARRKLSPAGCTMIKILESSLTAVLMRKRP
jgi:LysR family carnitine catabolism transcriptional activator